MLPDKTRIRRPGPDGDVELSISYAEQRPDPPALLPENKDAGGDGDGDTWEDDWDDADWDDEGPDAKAETEATPQPAPPVKKPMPAVFRLDASGLTNRGDLCQKK
jgi:hypothetical protein